MQAADGRRQQPRTRPKAPAGESTRARRGSDAAAEPNADQRSMRPRGPASQCDRTGDSASACMPVKCMRAMPAPMIGAAGRDCRAAAACRQGQAGHAATTTAISSEAMVSDRIVADGIAGLVGQHGHEVRGPDAGAGRTPPSGTPRPDGANLARATRRNRHASAVNDVAAQIEHGQKHEPKIVLIDNAGDDAKHEFSRRKVCTGVSQSCSRGR